MSGSIKARGAITCPYAFSISPSPHHYPVISVTHLLSTAPLKAKKKKKNTFTTFITQSPQTELKNQPTTTYNHLPSPSNLKRRPNAALEKCRLNQHSHQTWVFGYFQYTIGYFVGIRSRNYTIRVL